MIRWLQKSDGSMVLQEGDSSGVVTDGMDLVVWHDVPIEVDSAMRHTSNEECPICKSVTVPPGQSYAACYGRKKSALPRGG